jgi:hypothetical protein
MKLAPLDRFFKTNNSVQRNLIDIFKIEVISHQNNKNSEIIPKLMIFLFFSFKIIFTA